MSVDGLRERKRERARSELVSVGMHLFAERGFDATTVDEIAEAADVSRRTLFRYFGGKGDIVMEWARGTTTLLRDSLRARPLDEPPFASLQAAFTALCQNFAGNPSEIYAVTVMIERTPSLRAHNLLKHAQWEAALAGVLRERSPSMDDVRAALLARIAVAAFRTLLDEWINTEGRALPFDNLNRVFDLIRHDLTS